MPKFAANLTLTFKEVPFLERFSRAALHPFDAIEFMFPYEFTADDIAAALKETKLPLALFNAPPGETFGMAAIPGMEDKFKKSIELALSYAKILHNEKLHVMAGVIDPSPEAEATYIDNIRYAAEEAAKLDVLVVIEPLNPYAKPGYFLQNLDQAVSLLARINHPNAKLLFDIFHVQQIHGDLTHRLISLSEAGLIGHIQVAGVPKRHEPGTGELNDAYIFHLIDQLGYTGVIGCEYNPREDTETGLKWMSTL